MTFTEEEIKQVEHYASLYLSMEQICQLLDKNWLEFKDEFRRKSQPLRKAYERGKIQTTLELRKQEIDLAKLGSPMAIELVNKYAIEQKQGEKR